ncbi:MAG: aminopeptidase P N-terminal domain-containing protein [Bacteroidia bacterium]|nr:aminopeptidase P N-terminal domain-containing protein [Bacteroidia bacterium]
MKYSPLSSSFFKRNRANFAAAMKPNTIAVFHSNELLVTNADGNYRFTQNSNMYYLSGIDQEEVYLVLFPDAPNPDWKEMLFIRETSEHIQIWEGWKYSKEEARVASGIHRIYYYKEFETFLNRMASQCDGFYIDINEHERNAIEAQGPGQKIARKLRSWFPAHSLHRAAPILEGLRSLKDPEEVAQMQVAMDITEKAFRRVLGFVKPGVWENEIEAEIMHEFLRNRATGAAYDSIIATGKNACVLHYVQNEAQCKDGELILMDFGAEYGNYSADLTRTIPVNGRFSKRQRAVYDAVLRVMKAAKKMLIAGNYLEEYHREVGLLMQEELLELGLITSEQVKNQNPDWPAYKKYFMHGTSHFLGLDTHDVGNRYKPFQVGMIFTCEPGIYIPEEGIGIRLENNILITENGNTDMMGNIPIEADEIESLMNR